MTERPFKRFTARKKVPKKASQFLDEEGKAARRHPSAQQKTESCNQDSKERLARVP